MTAPVNHDIDIRIKVLSERGLSSRLIVKELKKMNIAISQSTVINVIKNKTKKRAIKAAGEKLEPFPRAKKARSKDIISKVNAMISTPNPISQRKMAKTLGVSQATINNIIHKDLHAKTRKKLKVYALTDEHRYNRKTNARKLYEDVLAGDRAEFAMTIDEAYFYLNYCNGERKISYQRPGQKLTEKWLTRCTESWPQGFMVVAGMCGRGPLKLIRVPPNVKINSEEYIRSVLKPFLEQEIPTIYPGEVTKVTLHHDKATSHTSKVTTDYLERQRSNGGCKYIKSSDIPVKGCDISPMDFFGFGYLKQRLFNRKVSTLDGLWKVLKEEWSLITPEKCREVFDSWKRRCRQVSLMDGGPIEHLKDIHRCKMKLTSLV